MKAEIILKYEEKERLLPGLPAYRPHDQFLEGLARRVTILSS